MNPSTPAPNRDVPTAAFPARPQVSREEITKLAEEIWREKNRPVGQDEAIWLEAERRLQDAAGIPRAAGTKSRPSRIEARSSRPRTKSSDPAEAIGKLPPASDVKESHAAGTLRNQ